jgi:hypothetical protein
MFKYLQIMRKLYSNPLHLGITLARPGTILPVIREITRIERNKKVLFWNQPVMCTIAFFYSKFYKPKVSLDKPKLSLNKRKVTLNTRI